jgi:glycerophosphoryl diester phosphodiesterase
VFPSPKPYFAPARPRVFAHRGLAVDAPENTLLAFEKAIAIGIAFVETDVNASKDGVAVVSHDPKLERVAGIGGQIKDFTLAELQAIDLGQGQTFSSLQEALTRFPETRFNIDIKSADAAQPAVDAILAASAADRVLIASFSERRRSAAARQLSNVATSAGGIRFLFAFLAGKVGLAGCLRHLLRGVDAVQIPVRVLGLKTTTPRMVGLFHGAGVEVHVWTINDEKAMAALLDRGVDGIVTDRADLAKKVIAQRA